jgi:hypothetical protein
MGMGFEPVVITCGRESKIEAGITGWNRSVYNLDYFN